MRLDTEKLAEVIRELADEGEGCWRLVGWDDEVALHDDGAYAVRARTVTIRLDSRRKVPADARLLEAIERLVAQHREES